jgi:hypothetical protein
MTRDDLGMLLSKATGGGTVKQWWDKTPDGNWRHPELLDFRSADIRAAELFCGYLGITEEDGGWQSCPSGGPA